MQRTLKFTRYLPEHGLRPLVLTVREDAEFQARDETMGFEAPPAEQIFRSDLFEPYRLYRRWSGERTGTPVDIRTTSRARGGWRERLSRAIRAAVFIPDARIGWLRPGTDLGRRILASHDVRAIVATGPPFTAHWIGRRLADHSGVPLILDYRDPWTWAPFYPERPGWARRLDQRLEHSCLRAAAAIVTVNRDIRDRLLARYAGLDPGRFHIIPNAYDEADFKGRTARRRDPWTWAHTGSLFADRIPHTFLEVLREWIGSHPELLETLRIRLAGRLDPEMERLLGQPPFDRVVIREGYLPHGESVQLLIDADLLLLLIAGDRQARGMITGKVFEYLGSERPILAVAPRGEAAEIIDSVGGSRIVDPEDRAGIRQTLEEARSAHQRSAPPFGSSDPDARGRYTRRATTGALAAIVRSLEGSGAPSDVE